MADSRNALVNLDLVHGIADKIAIDIRFCVQVNKRLRRHFLHLLAMTQILDSFLEQFAVHFKTNAGNVAMLLRTKQIAGSADFQVAHGNLEAGTEFRKLFHGLQALLRRLRQDLIRLVDKVRKSHMVRTADTPAHLIELRKAETICIVNDDGIGIGHIEPVLDNARGKQDIIIALIEIHHDMLEHFFRHLPVSRLDARIRHQSLQMVAHAVNGIDAIVDEIDLAAPAHLTLDGIGNDGIIILHHVRLHGETLCRRRLDDAHVTGSHQRHMECARYGRRRECQHIDASCQAADLILLPHAKPLLFINDQQARSFH